MTTNKQRTEDRGQKTEPATPPQGERAADSANAMAAIASNELERKRRALGEAMIELGETARAEKA